MVTKPRPWPNNAQNARDRAAEDAQAAARLLEDVAFYIGERCSLTQAETAHVGFKVARALNYCQNTLRHLESVGAPTRPA
jgi:hypothetical protein